MSLSLTVFKSIYSDRSCWMYPEVFTTRPFTTGRIVLIGLGKYSHRYELFGVYSFQWLYHVDFLKTVLPFYFKALAIRNCSTTLFPNVSLQVVVGILGIVPGWLRDVTEMMYCGISLMFTEGWGRRDIVNNICNIKSSSQSSKSGGSCSRHRCQGSSSCSGSKSWGS